MPKFIFVYRAAKGRDATADSSLLLAWEKFLSHVIGPNVVDPGWPVFEAATALGNSGRSTQVGGYSVVTADDMAAAVALAKGCPEIERGGGVEIAALASLPENHPAEAIRARIAQNID